MWEVVGMTESKQTGTSGEGKTESEHPRTPADLAMSLAEIDLTSQYAEHIKMWEIFANAVRLMLVVISLPFLSGGVLISAKAIDVTKVSDLGHLPHIISYITLGSGILGVLTLFVVIHIRLDVLLYARAINSVRGYYVATLEAAYPTATKLRPSMPLSSDAPTYFEPLRELGMLVIGFACVNAAYLMLAVVNLDTRQLPGFLVILGAVLLVILQYLAYFLFTCRSPIAGWNPLKKRCNGSPDTGSRGSQTEESGQRSSVQGGASVAAAPTTTREEPE